MIYWKVIIGHRNGSGVIRVFFRVSGGNRTPLPLVLYGLPLGGHPVGCTLLLPYGPSRPITSPGGSRNPSVLRKKKYSDHLEPFRCPNITFQYMNLYLSTILRLLVMSMISSETQKHITHNRNRHQTLSVRTLWVRELCRHD